MHFIKNFKFRYNDKFSFQQQTSFIEVFLNVLQTYSLQCKTIFQLSGKLFQKINKGKTRIKYKKVKAAKKVLYQPTRRESRYNGKS